MPDPRERVDRNADTAFERSDWPLGPVALVLAGIFAVLVVAPLALLWAYPNAASDVSRRVIAPPPPTPRLQVDPAAELARFRAEEERRLNSYYWLDKGKGIVHIPIAQAMRNLAERGIDGFPRAEP